MPFKMPFGSWGESAPPPSSTVLCLSKLPELPPLPELPKIDLKLPDLKLPKLPIGSIHLTRTQQRVALGVAGCAALAIAIRALPRRPRRRILPSARESIVELSHEERAELPYPPNALPGGRNVETPYGTVRVFEWGPETGERIMLVHGITTPCISLGDLAWEFARSGYRVILFDLFGRGYSSGPDPAEHPYDSKLYTSQILSVYTSSLAYLPAGCSTRFHLVGYSLGGTLCVSFARYYTHLIASLTLIAPSGLLRSHHMGFTGRMLYKSPSLLPSWMVPTLVRWRITPSLPAPANSVDEEPTAPNPASSEEAVAAYGGTSFDAAPISYGRPNVSVASVVRWQIQNHPGFVPAFVSTMAHSPIYGPGQPDWASLAEILAAQRAGRHHRSRKHKSRSSKEKEKERDRERDRDREKDRERRKEKSSRKDKDREKDKEKKERRSSKSSKSTRSGGGDDDGGHGSSSTSRSHRHEIPTLHGGKVLMVLGSQDPVIPIEETVQDALETLGDDGVQLAIVDGGHELPITQADEVASFVMSFLSNESLRIARSSEKDKAWDTQSEASSVFSSIKSMH